MLAPHGGLTPKPKLKLISIYTLANRHHSHQHDVEVCASNLYPVLLVMVRLPQAETKRNLSLQLKYSNLISYVQCVCVCVCVCV